MGQDRQKPNEDLATVGDKGALGARQLDLGLRPVCILRPEQPVATVPGMARVIPSIEKFQPSMARVRAGFTLYMLYFLWPALLHLTTLHGR